MAPRPNAAVAALPLLACAGGQVQVSGKHGEEFRLLIQQAWASYHAKWPFWLLRGRWRQQLLHVSVLPTVGCSAGSRLWSPTELREARSMLLRMTRRILEMWP